jgi:hypothetical protein
MGRIFVSGVSGEFKETRLAIGAAIDKLRNLGVTPVTQSTLEYTSEPDPNLVKTLIHNVFASEFVICLIGLKPGYPVKQAERQRVQAIAESVLTSSGNQLGDLWNKWKVSNRDVGMTYTQLEFFLAKSVYPEDKGVVGHRRVWVCRHNWGEVGCFKRRLVKPYFQRFLEFLEINKEEIDWGQDFRSVVAEAVVRVARFAVSRRDIRQGVPNYVPLNASIDRWVDILDDHSRTGGLNKEVFDRFYSECVKTRLEEYVIVLDAKSPACELPGWQMVCRCLRGGENAAEEFAFLIRSKGKVAYCCFQRKDLTVFSREIFDVNDVERVVGFDSSRRILLTFSDKCGYVLHQGGNGGKQTVDPQCKGPDPFTSKYAVMNFHGNRRAFAVCQGSSWYSFEQQGDGRWQWNESSEEPDGAKLELKFVQFGPFSMASASGQGREGEILLLNGWCTVSEEVIGIFREKGDSGIEFQLQRYRLESLRELFHAGATELLDGPCEHSVEIKKEGHSYYGILKDSQGKVHQVRVVSRFRCGISGGANISLKINHAGPFTGAEGWSSDGSWFVRMHQKKVGRDEKVKVEVFYLPSPTGENAREFISELRDVCQGKTRFSLSN